MWKKFIRDYFTFTRKERNGLIVLLCLMTGIVFWPSVSSLLYKEAPTDFISFQKEIDSFQNNLRQSKDNHTERDSEIASLPDLDATSNKNPVSNYTVELFLFDPNVISAGDWRKLGVKEKTIQTIINYRSKGGKFFRKEDLKKVYGFGESEYERLEPYIQIASGSGEVKYAAVMPSTSGSKTKAETEKTTIDLNAVDSSQLTQLDGIGPVLSSRIIKFRNRLGGFATVEQVKEVYGLSPETFDQIKDHISADPSNIKKISINTISLDELKSHPYFKNPIASTLISYRDQHGNFTSAADLKNVDLITDEVLEKILPYIEF